MRHCFNSGAAALAIKLRKVCAPRKSPSVVRAATVIPEASTVRVYPSLCSGTSFVVSTKRQTAASSPATADAPKRRSSPSSCSMISFSPAGNATASFSGNRNVPETASYFRTSGISTGLPSRSKFRKSITAADNSVAADNTTTETSFLSIVHSPEVI